MRYPRARYRAMANYARDVWAAEHGGTIPPVGAVVAEVEMSREDLVDMSEALGVPLGRDGTVRAFGATFRAGGRRG